MNVPLDTSKIEAALMGKMLGRPLDPQVELSNELIAHFLAQGPDTDEDSVHEAELKVTPSLRAETGDLNADWAADIDAQIEAKLMRQLFGAEEDEEDSILVRYVIGSATPEERKVVDSVLTHSPLVTAELADLQQAFEAAHQPDTVSAQTDSPKLYLVSNAPENLKVESAAPGMTAPPQPAAGQQPQRQTGKPQLLSTVVKVKWLVPAGVIAAAAMVLLYFRAGVNSKSGADRLAMVEQKRLQDENSRLKIENSRLAATVNDQSIAGDREIAASKTRTREIAALKSSLTMRKRELAALKKSKDSVIAMERQRSGLDLGSNAIPEISRMMGTVSNEIELVYPVGTWIPEDRPVLQWRRLPGTQFKSCTLNWFSVRNGKPEKNTSVDIQNQTQYRLPRLQRGQTYGWQIVITSQDGKELDTEVATFSILDAGKWELLKRSGREEQYRKDAEAYLKAGLLEKARRMIDMLDPDDDITRKLLKRLHQASKD